MGYTKISPLGKRSGKGTFDCFFDTDKYSSYAEAEAANDLVIVDFVENENGIRFFEFYHSRTPDVKKHQRLEIQHFPAGIDVFDDRNACEIATTLFL